MSKSSLEELKGRIAAGQYAVDSRTVADDILSKFAVIRRVARRLVSEDEEAQQAAGGTAPARNRGSRAAPTRRSRTRDERLS
jgi:preprotein translocase subunit SecA